MRTMLRMAALTEFHPEAFASCLERLREHARLKQRPLARLAGVSHTAISALERAEAPAPHPSQIHKLATGLATSASGHVDERRRDDLYLELMRAAGYLPAIREKSPDQVFRDVLTARLGKTGPRMELFIRKLEPRSEATQDAAIRVGEILLDSDAR